MPEIITGQTVMFTERALSGRSDRQISALCYLTQLITLNWTLLQDHQGNWQYHSLACRLPQPSQSSTNSKSEQRCQLRVATLVDAAIRQSLKIYLHHEYIHLVQLQFNRPMNEDPKHFYQQLLAFQSLIYSFHFYTDTNNMCWLRAIMWNVLRDGLTLRISPAKSINLCCIIHRPLHPFYFTMVSKISPRNKEVTETELFLRWQMLRCEKQL